MSGGSGGFSLSGGTGAGTGASDDDADSDNAELTSDAGSSGGAAGSGGILSSFLKLSGPILSSSASSAKGGQTVALDDSEE